MRPAFVLTFALCIFFADSYAQRGEPQRQRPRYGRQAQTSGVLHGEVLAKDGTPLNGAQISIEGTNLGSVSRNGHYHITRVPAGEHVVHVRLTGYERITTTVNVAAGTQTEASFTLTQQTLELDPMTVTGTRTVQRRMDSPTKVDVVPPEMFQIDGAVNLAEGLERTTGVRVENNCQNCNFYSVRLNGLEGAYTQILVNGRPTVSSLAAVYLLDQMPSAMIDRLEVVKGGGSALYGGSAVAGVVNVITRRPELEQTSLGMKLGWVNGKPDRTGTITTTLLDDSGRLGSFFFAQARNRNPIDINSDGFSELGMLESGSFGAQMFYNPTDNLDISFEMHYIGENRRGGDQVTSTRPHEAVVAESIESRRFGGGFNLNQRLNAWTDYNVYTSLAFSKRDTYYGSAEPVFEGNGQLGWEHDLNAYGSTRNPMLSLGAQLNHRFDLDRILTLGVEFNRDHLEDHIPAYDLLTDEVYHSVGVLGQYDWQARPWLNLVVGARLEKHSEINNPIVSPRLSGLFRLSETTALRASFSTGFRPPMVFDEDLHITQVGGEGQIIINDPDLEVEKSYSFSAGMEYNRTLESGWTVFASLSGFHTILDDAFNLVFDGIHDGAFVNRRVNAGSASVHGLELEATAKPADFLSLRGGWTVQKSLYSEAVDISFDEDNPMLSRGFLRTPNLYGFVSATWELFNDRVDLDTSLDITGPMSAINAESNIYRKDTPWFAVFDTKVSYRFGNRKFWKVFVHGHNLFDSYQDDLDRSVLSANPSEFRLRDSGYVYGPGRPRSFYTGMEIGF